LKKTKSDVLLETLSRAELRAFNSFIKGRLNGKSRDVLDYWETKYSVSKVIVNYSEKEKVTRKTLSDFNKQLERFIINRNLEKDQFGSILYLVRELRSRNIEKYFIQLIKDMNKFRHHNFDKGYQNTLALLKLNFEEYLLHNSRSDEPNLYRTSKERVKLSEIISVYNKLFEYFNDVYYGPDNKYKDTGLLKIRDVVAYVEENSQYLKKYYPNVWTLYLIYLSLENSASYERIITAFDFFEKHEDRFTEEFLFLGYDSLLRLLFTNLNSGNTQAINEIYKILLRLESRGILKRIPHFQPRILPGFIIISLNFGNIPLAEKIVNEYRTKVIESFREQAVNISLAMIELAYGRTGKIKGLLENLKPHDPMLYIFCKSTLLKAYYERGDFKHIYPITDAFKHFLQRRTDISEIFNSASKFLYYINKLASAKKNNRKGLSDIEYSLSKENYFFQKRWITEKFNELKSSAD
jgi:hypothetical protein